ncbi:MAG: isoprenylcysteine carboxylmethyltransferase family protein [Acidimicrobiia bacterium]|nr:isoprenylcysteine carboxylmethyltransferase family protein [Acidimicrobiia bacterium]
MLRLLALLYGLIGYVVFLGAFLYLIGFVGNRYTFSTVDSGLQIPAGEAFLVNLALLAGFAMQHSIMARRGFKKYWRRIVPAPVERTTYVMASSVTLAAIFRYWEPMPDLVWFTQNPAAVMALHVLFWAGWAMVVAASVQIGHAELFGLRQVWLYARGKPYTPPAFHAPGFYRYLRHPMMVGMVAGFWSTPEMSQGHLMLAGFLTLYVVAARKLEERDLRRDHGSVYESYMRRVAAYWPRRLRP